MYQDGESGVWETSLAEDKWATERARELAIDSFNTGDLSAITYWLLDDPEAAAAFIVRVIKLLGRGDGHPLSPSLEDLRAAFVDATAEDFEDEAWDELAEAQRETDW